MRNFILLSIIILLFAMTGCNPKQDGAPISLQWEMGQNNIEPGCYENTFYITNEGNKPLDNRWIIYFNQLPAAVIVRPDAPFIVEEISSTYYKLYPSAHYTPIPAGESIPFTFRCRGNIIKEASAPEGTYMVRLDENGQETTTPQNVPLTIKPFTHEYQWSRKGTSELPYPYGNLVYEQNTLFAEHETIDNETDIFPSLKEVTRRKGTSNLTPNIQINYEPAFQGEAELLTEKLEKLFGCTVSDSGETIIELKQLTSNPKPGNNEYYEMLITGDNTVRISGVSAHAVFNGCQTLLAIIGNKGGLPCTVSHITIKDYPDLFHRGQMIDVCRNFTTKENLLKLIDIFSTYKLNVLHLHVTDDEGWRLEIPGLEELTEVGARRGHTLDESTCLYPAYGGGWDANDAQALGSGYYTRKDFIEILEYARKRHVTLIPEVDLPGHARSAIKAMNVRYNKYIKTDPKKAEEYLLIDFNDNSKYLSAQWYTDNVINVAMPSTYKFVQKVIDEIDSMYKEAGVKLTVLHLGGDEVPHGAWEGSQICREFMEEREITEIRDLKDYFVEKVLDMLYKKNIQLAGWQEVVLMPDEKSVNKQFAGRNILSYCWNSVPEWGSSEIPYQLANAGYPIILCNVTNLYFDLAYNKHQKEPGHYWGGFVDEYTSFDMLPYDIYKSVRHNMKGEKVNLAEAAKGKTQLSKAGRSEIRGMQGQLWAETIRSYDMVEYYLFPKMFGLIDRAWNTQPAWASSSDEKQHDKAQRKYNAKIAGKELPRLSHLGVNFRISQPGIMIKEGKLYANSTIPGAVIRYTTDGSEPTANSPAWTNAIDCDSKQVKAKAFYLDRESVTTLLINE